MYSHQERSPASRKTSTLLVKKTKEQETVCFSKGAIFQCTYNQDGVFSHSRISLCYDVPQKNDLEIFRGTKMLAFPPTIKYDTFIFDSDLPKDHCIQIGFKEVSSGQYPEHILFLMT